MENTAFLWFLLLMSSVGFAAAGDRPVVPEQLHALILQADRIVVREDPRNDAKVLLDTRRREDIEALNAALKIGVPAESFVCACLGSPELLMFKGEKEIARFTNHHGLAVRTQLWSSDAPIMDTDSFVRWFDERGIHGPQEEVDYSRREQRESQVAADRWERAMPSSVRPLWREIDQLQPDISAVAAALEKEIPERNARILVLFSWYGSGRGPWSGCPCYEDLPAEMLFGYRTADLLEGIKGKRLSDAQTEGVARFFASWEFAQRRKGEIRILADELCAALLAHAAMSTDSDKLARARHAFQRKDGERNKRPEGTPGNRPPCNPSQPAGVPHP
jgi:hypothetical protein